MDTKKFFELECKFDELKPEFSEKEICRAIVPEAEEDEVEVKKVSSFNITSGPDGIYMKIADSEGKHQMLHLNPVVVAELLEQVEAELYPETLLEGEEQTPIPNKKNIH